MMTASLLCASTRQSRTVRLTGRIRAIQKRSSACASAIRSDPLRYVDGSWTALTVGVTNDIGSSDRPDRTVRLSRHARPC